VRHVVIIIAVICLMGTAFAGITFDVGFTDARYIKLFKGAEDNIHHKQKDNDVDEIVPATTGELRNKKAEIIGHFTVVYASEHDSIAQIHLNKPHHLDEIKYLSIDALEMDFLNLEFLDSQIFFTINKGWKDTDPDNFKNGAKGILYDKEGRESAQFKVLVVGESAGIGVITDYAAGVYNRDIKTGKVSSYFHQIMQSTGFANLSYLNMIMLLIGGVFIYLGIAKDYEPLLLVPIGFGILIGNIPMPLHLFNAISVYMIDPVTHEYAFNTTSNSVMGLIYFGVRTGLYPPLIFLGIGALTDFSSLLSNPKSVLLGAAAQMGIFITFLGALWLGFSPANAAAIGIIGGADGPTAIFLSSRLAPSLIGPIAIAAYSYMAMVPIIQPPIMKLLTTRKERLIKMKPGRKVKKIEKILFPITGMILTTLVAPGGLPLLGMLFFGNLLKESGVTGRLAKTASSSLLDIATILLGVAVGASTTAQVFLNEKSVLIFVLGVLAFAIATASGVTFAKVMNLFVKNKVNPLIGAAGVSAVPDSARVAQMVGRAEDPNNYLLMHAMGPNVAGVIGSAIAAGVFLGIF